MQEIRSVVLQEQINGPCLLCVMLMLLRPSLQCTENSVDCVDDSVVDIKCSNLVYVTVEKSFDGSQDSESSECFKCPLEKVYHIGLLHCSRGTITLRLFLPEQHTPNKVRKAYRDKRIRNRILLSMPDKAIGFSAKGITQSRLKVFQSSTGAY
ncbi:hypothetical protein ACB098_05G185600 [Castanea mollissima]